MEQFFHCSSVHCSSQLVFGLVCSRCLSLSLAAALYFWFVVLRCLPLGPSHYVDPEWRVAASTRRPILYPKREHICSQSRQRTFDDQRMSLGCVGLVIMRQGPASLHIMNDPAQVCSISL